MLLAGQAGSRLMMTGGPIEMAEDVPPRRIVVFCGPYNDEIVAEHVEALVGAFPSWKFIVDRKSVV